MTEDLKVSNTAFGKAFAVASILVGHDLCEHPLLQLDAIASLADRLPRDQVRRERGDLRLDNRGYVDAGEGPPSRTILGIGDNGCRVSLREIQSDRAYSGLVERCLDQLAAVLGAREGGMCRRAGYIFVTAPGATTPMHFDPEHSLLLQISGHKTAYSVPRADSASVQRELDRYYDGARCDVDTLTHQADRFDLAPGDGVYLPSFVPHWVSTKDDVSVSFSIPFYTRFSEQAEYVNRVNTRLRKFGFSPSPPGRSKTADRAKATLLRSWTNLRRSQRAGT